MDENAIISASKLMYTNYEQVFGTINCTYSIHLVCSHLLQIRRNQPLTENSAFKFESFYGELRRSFVPGTPSTLKQMLQTVYLRRSLHHNCLESIYYSEKETEQQSNSLIYTFKLGEYEAYKIISINNLLMTCYPIGLFKKTFHETPQIDWQSVGVFKKGGVNETEVIINKKDIAGKLLQINGLLITCPNNVLREK